MKDGIFIKIKFLFQLVLVTMVLSGLTACYNEKSNGATAESNEVKFDKNKDLQFLLDAAEMSLEQIKFAQFAQKNSANIDIQEFGKMIEAGYTSALNELIPLAESKGLTIPIALTDKSQTAYNQLVATPINYFDRAYCDVEVNRHEELVAKFQKVFTESSDDKTRRWALSKLPELRQNLAFSLMTQKKLEPVR
jgi:predicted outer membrane protein